MKKLLLFTSVLVIASGATFVALVRHHNQNIINEEITPPAYSAKERSQNACLVAQMHEAGFYNVTFDIATAKNLKGNKYIIDNGDKKLTQEAFDAMVEKCTSAEFGGTP